MKNLREVTRAHLAEIELNSEQLDALSALMRNDEETSEPESKSSNPSAKPPKVASDFRRIWITVGVAAIILVLFFVSVDSNKEKTKPEAIAQEVAYNHLKLKPLEIESGSIGDVVQYFEKHAITVLPESSVLTNFSWDVQGARFCSIQGADAAQLRYTTPTNDTVSVYMAPYSSGPMGDLPNVDAGEKPIETVVDGQSVWIWVESNQVVAATIPTSQR